eukprot:5610056-Ditylum_brightwellii.AAC.1
MPISKNVTLWLRGGGLKDDHGSIDNDLKDNDDKNNGDRSNHNSLSQSVFQFYSSLSEHIQ